MYSLLHHNTFGIDAKCRDFCEYTSEDELRKLLSELKGERILHIGGGSNLLFVNDYFDGCVLHSRIDGLTVARSDENGIFLRVGAGCCWDDFVDYCVRSGYYGLENLSLIPGEVGASAVQNIGAYGAEACQRIETVEAIEVATGEKRVFRNDECDYSYRNSVFKNELRGRYIVTYVTYRLSLTFKPDLEYGAIKRMIADEGVRPEDVTAQLLRDTIIKIRREKLPDPHDTGSAGSFFMNPVVDTAVYESLFKQYPEMPHYDVEGGVKIPAGWMIERCGWKGKSLGRAGVYPKQALVLVNNGGATGQDIVRLCNAIIDDVRGKFGITLHPEANFIS